MLLDSFGKWPEGANDQSRVRLNEEQAYQLTLRMEFAGKTFVVEPYTWERLDKCEETVQFRTRVFRNGKEDFVYHKSIVGEVCSDGITGGWAYHEFDVDVSWNSFELLAEGHSGYVILIHGERPSDATYDFEAEKEIKAIRMEWTAKEIKASEAQKAKDEELSLQLAKESAVLYKKMKEMMDARPKAFCHVFPPRVDHMVHIPVVSKKCQFDQRPKAAVELPTSLEGSLFPGTWHVAFKCNSDPRHPMTYRLGIRYTTGTHLQVDRMRRGTTGNQEESEAERQRKKREEESKAIKNADMRVLERIKWENWNKVGLAKALMVKYKDDFYPPKNHEKSVDIQKLVRGFLARQRLKWLQEVDLRRVQLKEKEERMKEELPYEDKLHIRRNRQKTVPQELDDQVIVSQKVFSSISVLLASKMFWSRRIEKVEIFPLISSLFLVLNRLQRFAEGAATMLRYGDLQNPYKLAQAARAIFNVMDADGSGCMDVDELKEALKMLGIDKIKDEDLVSTVFRGKQYLPDI